MQVTSLKLSKKLAKVMRVRPVLSWYYTEAWDKEKGFYKTWVLDSKTCPVGMGASTKIIPAYTLDELLEEFGNLLTVKARKRDGNEAVWVTVMNGGRNGRGVVGLMSFEGHVWNWYKKIDVEVNKAETAGELLLWCIENGYKETNYDRI